MARSAPPRYLINPLATMNNCWTPSPWQVLMGQRNPSRLNAIWLATFWNVGVLPYRILMETLLPLFHFKFLRALLSLIVIPASAVLFVFFGVFLGRLRALELTSEQAARGLVLGHDQCLQLLSMGRRELVVDMNSVRL